MTGTSGTAINHSNFFFNEAINKLDLNKSHILEIASNDGTFLSEIKIKSKAKVLGIDPAKNISKLAKKKGRGAIAFNGKLLDIVSIKQAQNIIRIDSMIKNDREGK